jgi:hypothetical protein
MPCRDEVLVLRLLERELPQEAALLALVDDSSARVLCSAAVPLRHLTPGQHFNLRLALPGAGELFVTLCLATAPQHELARWREQQGGCDGVLHARLAECEGAVIPEDERARCFGVVACFDVEAAGAAGAATGSSQGAGGSDVRSSKEPGAKQSDAKASDDLSDSSDEKSSGSDEHESEGEPSTPSPQPARSDSPDVPSTEPSAGETQTDGSSPQSAGSPTAAMPSDAALTLQTLYTPLAGMRTAMLPTLEKLAQAQTVSSRTVMPIVGSRAPAEQMWPVMHGALRALGKGLLAANALTVSLYLVPLAGAGRLIGKCHLPLRRLPADGAGALTAYRDLDLEGAAKRATAQLELRFWSPTAYLDILQAAVPPDPDDAELWSTPGPASAKAPGSLGGMLGGPAVLLQTLVGDVAAKQIALERLQRVSDLATSRSDMAMWRLRDMSSRNDTLDRTIADLRRMLHDNNAGVASATAENLSTLSTAELEERCKLAAARLKTEQVKNLELVKRLKVRIIAVQGAKEATIPTRSV